MTSARIRLLASVALASSCRSEPRSADVVLTFPGSAVGAEAQVLRRQLASFMTEHPGIRVVQQRTPDAAGQRRQLYVQWLNARASDPDILQLDVIWAPEFAAAGWILPLDRFGPDTSAFFPAPLAAGRWRDTLYALPWFVDVGMLYWRTDLAAAPPATFTDLTTEARRIQREHGIRHGLVWQGARYEGLVTTFLEYLGGFGGRILGDGRVEVASPAGRRALIEMRDEIYGSGVVPAAALTWHEEEVRFAFQNGEAAFMRNWPYALRLLDDSSASRVAGRFAVAPMPSGEGGSATAALGGQQLAINRNTEHPDAAWTLIAFLTDPERMLERARVAGQLPARRSLYEGPGLGRALPISSTEARRVIERAVPRPVTPVYSELSEILQIHLHRALTNQADPIDALESAEREMQRVLDRVGLGATGRIPGSD